MVDVQTAKVPFNRENIGKCLCPQCLVQAKSRCVSDKKPGLASAVARSPLNFADIPGEYCSAGPATCGDLDSSQTCSCFDCLVYVQYSLADGSPHCYYCSDGRAQ